jgi:hypothetical protein
MATKLFLCEIALRVGIAALSKNCPNFKADLTYQVRSRVGVEAFHIFVGALEGAAPVLTTENIRELLSLCNEFGFTGFLCQVSEQPVVDDGTRKGASDITEEKLQIRQALCSLQEVLSRLGNHEMEQKALKREIAGLREAHARSDSEVAELHSQLAQTKQEVESFPKQNSVPAPIRQFPFTSEPLGWIVSQGIGSLTGGGSQPRKVDFTRCSGIFRLRGVGPRHRKIPWRLPCLTSTFLHQTPCI